MNLKNITIRIAFILLIINAISHKIYAQCTDSLMLWKFWPYLNSQDSTINYINSVNDFNKLCDSAKSILSQTTSIYSSSYSEFCAFNGRYAAAIEQEIRKKYNTIPQIDSVPFLGMDYFSIDTAVFPKLREVFKSNRVVILNEAHDYPNHRLFLQELLPILKQEGFTTIAMETLNQDLNHVVDFNVFSGLFTNEPIFGSVIRSALNQGFSLKQYDHYPETPTSDSEPNYRDSMEAVNLLNILKQIPDTQKLFIYCGYGHLYEKIWGTTASMGYFLHKIGGIDPYTIDQESYSEVGINLFYQQILDNFNIKKRVLLTKIPDNPGGVDLFVITPKSQYKYGRPTWLEHDDVVLKPFKMEKGMVKHEFVLVQAFDNQENFNKSIDQLIPNDQILFKKGENMYSLALRRGHTYNIVYRGADNKVILSKTYKF